MVVGRRSHSRPLNPDREYSVREAAKRLDVTYEVVLRYIRDGKLRATKVRTKGLREEWRINQKEIEEFSSGHSRP